MDLSTELIGGAFSVTASLVAGVKWAAVRFTKIETELRAAHASALAECREREEQLVQRLVALEDRSHTEDREDRAAMLKIMDQSASALSAIAHRLPEPTPPRGSLIPRPT